jgi:hypothetical protein
MIPEIIKPLLALNLGTSLSNYEDWDLEVDAGPIQGFLVGVNKSFRSQ